LNGSQLPNLSELRPVDRDADRDDNVNKAKATRMKRQFRTELWRIKKIVQITNRPG